MFTPLAQLSLTWKIRQKYLNNDVSYLSDDGITVDFFYTPPLSPLGQWHSPFQCDGHFVRVKIHSCKFI